MEQHMKGNKYESFEITKRFCSLINQDIEDLQEGAFLADQREKDAFAILQSFIDFKYFKLERDLEMKRDEIGCEAARQAREFLLSECTSKRILAIRNISLLWKDKEASWGWKVDYI